MVNDFKVAVKIENEKRLIEFKNLEPDFTAKMNDLLYTFIFRIHRYLIKVTPLDTGELRGGWTSILNKYSKDYAAQIFDVTYSDDAKAQNKTLEGRTYHLDYADVIKGASQSEFEEHELKEGQSFDITLINKVIQGEYMEHGTGKIQARNFTANAMSKGEDDFKKLCEQWFGMMAQEEKVVDPKIFDTIDIV